jgi:SnoaL-like domain
MDQADVRAVLEHYLETADADTAHEIYHDDAVLEFPQSGERFAGVENFREWRRQYPASVDYEIQRIRGAGDVWIAEVTVSYDGGPANHGVTILEFRDDRVAKETIYIGEGWEAPEWRARWRESSAEGR